MRRAYMALGLVAALAAVFAVAAALTPAYRATGQNRTLEERVADLEQRVTALEARGSSAPTPTTSSMPAGLDPRIEEYRIALLRVQDDLKQMSSYLQRGFYSGEVVLSLRTHMAAVANREIPACLAGAHATFIQARNLVEPVISLAAAADDANRTIGPTVWGPFVDAAILIDAAVRTVNSASC